VIKPDNHCFTNQIVVLPFVMYAVNYASTLDQYVVVLQNVLPNVWWYNNKDKVCCYFSIDPPVFSQIVNIDPNCKGK